MRARRARVSGDQASVCARARACAPRTAGGARTSHSRPAASCASAQRSRWTLPRGYVESSVWKAGWSTACTKKREDGPSVTRQPCGEPAGAASHAATASAADARAASFAAVYACSTSTALLRWSLAAAAARASPARALAHAQSESESAAAGSSAALRRPRRRDGGATLRGITGAPRGARRALRRVARAPQCPRPCLDGGGWHISKN